MIKWPHRITTLEWTEIEVAVKDDDWQLFRLSLKGITTNRKLEKLNSYVETASIEGELPRVEQVRIDNYINALLRGGQLIRRGNEILMQR